MVLPFAFAKIALLILSFGSTVDFPKNESSDWQNKDVVIVRKQISKNFIFLCEGCFAAKLTHIEIFYITSFGELPRRNHPSHFFQATTSPIESRTGCAVP